MKVQLSTLLIPPEGWVVELDVDPNTTIAKLKEILVGIRGGPRITSSTKIIHRPLVGQMYTLQEHECVRRDMCVADVSQQTSDARHPPSSAVESTTSRVQPPSISSWRPSTSSTNQIQKPQFAKSQRPQAEQAASSGLIRIPFQRMDTGLQKRLIRRVAESWPSQPSTEARHFTSQAFAWQAGRPSGYTNAYNTAGQPPGTSKMSVLLSELQQNLRDALRVKTFKSIVKIVGEIFEGAQLLHMHKNGFPLVSEATLQLAERIRQVLSPIVVKHGYSDSVAGVAQAIGDCTSNIDQQPDRQVSEVARFIFLMTFGLEDFTFEERVVAHIIWISVLGDAVPPVAQCVAFLYHLALPPWEQRRKSASRTIACIKMLAVVTIYTVYNDASHSSQYPEIATKAAETMPKLKASVIWVLGATDEQEGVLARCGLFEDAGQFLSTPCTIYLIGSGFKGSWPQGGQVKVYAHTWEEAAAGTLPPPLLAFVFNSGIGTLEEDILKQWLPRLATFLLPSKSNSKCTTSVSGDKTESERTSQLQPLLVFTCRSEAEAAGEKALLDMLGAAPVLHALKDRDQARHVRNLYSAMAGNPDVEYDENGWFYCVWGTTLDETAFQDRIEDVSTLVEDVSSKMSRSSIQASPSPEENSELQWNKDEEEGDSKSKDQRSPVVFWGILDLKYNPGKGPDDLVKVLETGDGRMSKFSGYGAAIREKLTQEHKLEEALRRAVLTENKKLTHDTIVESGYSYLRPKQLAFPKIYTPGLKDEISAALNLSEDSDDVCILKLCNRARSAGVLPAKLSELDNVLKILLTPPTNVEAWFTKQSCEWYCTVKWGCFEEQVRHWWSNECPIFVVEEFCQSMSTFSEDGKELDGTMRVGFSLLREDRDKVPDGWDKTSNGKAIRQCGAEDAPTKPLFPWGDDRPYMDLWRPGHSCLRLQWLGGYWKLPTEDLKSEDLRGRVVSVAKQGTAPVCASRLGEVYAALGDMVPRLFSAQDLSNTKLLQRYTNPKEFGAFTSARLACSMRVRDKRKCQMVLQLAEQSVAKLNGPLKDITYSYIRRNLGVQEALKGSWQDATREFKMALQSFPTNSNARYLLGTAYLELGQTKEAARCLGESLLLDPDFKACYCNLGVARLRLADYEGAAQASEALLIRHPSCAQGFYNLGVSQFALMCKAIDAGSSSEKLREDALANLQVAHGTKSKDQVWKGSDATMLAWLEEQQEEDMPCSFAPSWPHELPRDGWRFINWRP